MKTISKVTAIAFVAAILVQPAMAQKPDHGNMHRHERQHSALGKMKGLNLTEAQKQSFKNLSKEFAQQRGAIMQMENITVKEQRDQLFALKKQQHNKLEQLLTADQKAKAQENKKNEDARRNAMHQKMAAKLNLTQQQQDQLEKIRKQQAEMLGKMKAAETRSQFENLREQLKANHEKALKSILTEEQLQQMEAMQNEHKHKRPHRQGPRPHPKTAEEVR